MTDFTRINAPRVEKIAAMIGVIRKSARSQKISAEDVAELLAPVAALMAPAPILAEVSDAEKQQIAEAGPGAVMAIEPPAPLREAPHIEQIAGFVAALPSEHLPSYITHLVNRLCEQAEQSRSAA
jgi:hypothetical protein